MGNTTKTTTTSTTSSSIIIVITCSGLQLAKHSMHYSINHYVLVSVVVLLSGEVTSKLLDRDRVKHMCCYVLLSGEVTSKLLDRDRVKHMCSDRVIQYQHFVSCNLHILSK